MELLLCRKGWRFDESFPKRFAVLHLQNSVRELPSGLQRAWRRMNERTQARRAIRQRAPLRPAAGAAILPNQFAVDPHPQLFDRDKTLFPTFFEKSTAITITFPETCVSRIDRWKCYGPVGSAKFGLWLWQSILILGYMVILRRCISLWRKYFREMWNFI